MSPSLTLLSSLAITEALEARGVMRQLKAKIRADIFNVLDEQV
jgi:hypothetical protein